MECIGKIFRSRLTVDWSDGTVLHTDPVRSPQRRESGQAIGSTESGGKRRQIRPLSTPHLWRVVSCRWGSLRRRHSLCYGAIQKTTIATEVWKNEGRNYMLTGGKTVYVSINKAPSDSATTWGHCYSDFHGAKLNKINTKLGRTTPTDFGRCDRTGSSYLRCGWAGDLVRALARSAYKMIAFKRAY